MAARPAQGPNMDQFEAYFQKADLDRDGRISGAEAVAFFQGSNLSKQILAQIWMHSDRNGTGFLGRAEFYNALRLVTVAQSGRELTKEIVKAALEGPAAARIPVPQINPVATSVPVNTMPAIRPFLNSMTPSSSSSSSSQLGHIPPTTSQSFTFPQPQPQTVPNAGVNQQLLSASNTMRPFQASPSQPTQFFRPGIPGGGNQSGPSLPGSNTSNTSTDWFGGRIGISHAGSAQIPSEGISTLSTKHGFSSSSGFIPATATTVRPAAGSMQSTTLPPRPVSPLLSSSQSSGKDLKSSVLSGNGFPSTSGFGGDVFLVSQPKQDAPSMAFLSSGIPATSISASVSVASQPSHQPIHGSSLPALASVPSVNGQLQQTQQLIKTNGLSSIAVVLAPGGGATAAMPSPADPQWQKMSRSDIQKYIKVFVEVDKDRDGKISGEEARNLFLSWRLPRDVLKKVWDLSDQDNDSMLSLREFCVALYLMERHREGHPLPVVLPKNLILDDELLRVTSQHPLEHVAPVRQPIPDYAQQAIPGPHPPMDSAGRKPQQQIQKSFQNDGQALPVQKKSTVPELEKHLVNQLSNEEQSTLNSKLKDAENADKKVQELEKEIMDSNEKIEFYRTKMQELILYKSRCDNRLNEIIERASADKREADTLARKYETKCKLTGDVASKLTAGEASFQDIQEKKLEIYNAIVKMNEDGITDGLLQDHADQIQNDLEELVKSLNDRCKKYGVRVKPTLLAELPFGWQPVVQEGAIDWDEEWDKFEDEGFVLEKDLADARNLVAQSSYFSVRSSKEDMSPPSLSDDDRAEKISKIDERVSVSDSTPAYSENGFGNSPPGSPKRDALENQPFHSTRESESSLFRDNRSDHDGAESTISGGTYADEHSWGATFDTSDDIDSIWGFDPPNKDFGDDKNKQSSFFDSDDFGLKPIRTDSPSASSTYGKEKCYPFADSVPATPSYSSGFSPKYTDGVNISHDGFGHFDSFNAQGSLARFDSIRSTSDFDQGGFFSQKETLVRFDSIRSTNDADHGQGFTSFSDSDPFGTGPFKSSEFKTPENNTPRKASDNWSSF